MKKIKVLFTISIMLFSLVIVHETKGELSDKPPMHADWIIEHGEYYFDETFTIDGNITIKNGASLTLYQTIIKMVSSHPGEHKIKVENGGALYLDTSLITSSSNHCWQSRLPDATLTSPTIELNAGSAHLSFWSKYPSKSTPGVLEILEDGAWKALPFSAGNPGKWNHVVVNLNDSIGKEIKLRFRAAPSDISAWLIDDISIPEIGFFDSGEGEIHWNAVGWIKTENPPKNPFLFMVEKGGEIEIKNSIIAGCGYEENPPSYDHSGLWINSDDATIQDSIISQCFDGIVLYNSNYITLQQTEINQNDDTGILVISSHHVSLQDCEIYNNSNGIKIVNSSLSLNPCEIYDNQNYGMAILDYSSINFNDVSIHNNKDGARFIRWNDNINDVSLYQNENGMEILNCNGLRINGIKIYQNEVGIKIVNSSNVTVKECNLSANECGIWTNAFNNLFFHNNFIGNEIQAWDEGSNSWDNGKEGNYWDDYDGSDTNGDGIGDTPYDIPGGENKDRYPLMNPVGIDTMPPRIEIIRPSNHLYIGDREIIPTASPVIFGKITVVAEVTDYSSIKKVEFFVDGVYRYEDKNEPYEWEWNEPIIGKHVLGISSTDAFDNVGESSITVAIFNI